MQDGGRDPNLVKSKIQPIPLFSTSTDRRGRDCDRVCDHWMWVCKKGGETLLFSAFKSISVSEHPKKSLLAFMPPIKTSASGETPAPPPLASAILSSLSSTEDLA